MGKGNREQGAGDRRGTAIGQNNEDKVVCKTAKSDTKIFKYSNIQIDGNMSRVF